MRGALKSAMLDFRRLLVFALLSQAHILSAQDAGKVRVNVYRYKQIYGKAIRPSIYCDETDVARLQDGRFVVLALTPGKHTFRSNDKQSVIDLELKPGQEYYIRVDIAPGFAKAHGRITLVQPEQGAAEFKQMKPADADMIKNRTFLISDSGSEKVGAK